MSDQNFSLIKDFFYYFKSKILTNKTKSSPSRKFFHWILTEKNKLNKSFFFFSINLVLNNKDEEINFDFSEKTSIIKKKLIQREEILEIYQQQINQVDQQLLLFHQSLQEDSSLHSSPSCYSSLYALELL